MRRIIKYATTNCNHENKDIFFPLILSYPLTNKINNTNAMISMIIPEKSNPIKKDTMFPLIKK
jgi:hypothetical protein